jgi:hypothetical protein
MIRNLPFDPFPHFHCLLHKRQRYATLFKDKQQFDYKASHLKAIFSGSHR